MLPAQVLVLVASLSSILLEELHSVPEYLQPFAFLFQPQPGPLWVLRREQVPVWVRHEAHCSPGHVTDAGDVVLGAVGVDGITAAVAVGIDIAKHDLTGLSETVSDPLLAAHEFTFAMTYRNVDE